MTRAARCLVFGAVLVLLAVAGCRSGSDSTARFVRYTKLPDGAQAAVIAVPAMGSPSEEQIATTNLTDLEAGEVVDVRSIGKDWDEPQWSPAIEVVGRAND